MCGILGIATVRSRSVSVDDRAVERMRDLMARRGPDGAGLWRERNIVLAHRRLAVRDLSEAGRQPMVIRVGQGAGEDGAACALVYNGELYNDAELRRELAGKGVCFRTACDAETVLHALAAWGVGAFDRLRGMYSIGFYDGRTGTLLLGRDPLGIKPLYWSEARGDGSDGGGEIVFASEIPAILAHRGVKCRPDLVTVSSYLSTIRLVLGERTLFAGVRTVRPGQVLEVDLNGDEPRVTRHDGWSRERVGARGALWRIGDGRRGEQDAGAKVRAAVIDSVDRHLHADVPICCLLSGGLDSSIIASVAAGRRQDMRTYCSGAAPDVTPSPRRATPGDDFSFARIMARRVGGGSRHAEAPVGRALFRERWGWMVETMGLPLGTPNEVAINEVARALRADGQVVALSGEGADELFAGYAGPMTDAATFVVSGRRDPGRFQIDGAAWVPLAAKAAILNEDARRAVEGDAALVEFYESEFAGAGAEREDEHPLQAHLRFHRRINLAGLLARLDTATMLEGVEGRTPLADIALCELAESLPMRDKFVPGAGGALERAETKRALRGAFAADLPPEIVSRPKASFPLPFQRWLGDSAGDLRGSGFARELFTKAAIETVAARPEELWSLAWPMINVAKWGERWWG